MATAPVPGWVEYAPGAFAPPDHPLAKPKTAQTQTPGQPATQTAGQPPANAGPDPFASIGGGVYVNGNWVPKNHPLAQQASAQSSGQPGNTAGGGQPSGQGKGGYYGGSQTGPQPYNVTSQGQTATMDVLGQRLTQDPFDISDNPAIKQQADAFRANLERQRRNQLADAAEAMGPYATGALQGTDRMLRERAGIAAGSFEADLVGREIAARRAEVADAITTMTGLMTADQQRALQRELAALDAELARLGITTGANTAAREIGVRERLGVGGLNVDLLDLLLRNQQFGDRLGLDTAMAESEANNAILRILMGGQ